MISVQVKFNLKKAISVDEAKELFMDSANNYKGLKGLIRKYYLISEDGKTAGGVYLWDSRKEAEKLFSDDWHAFILTKYGVEPEVHYFHTPVVVDNISGEILSVD